MTQPRSVWFAIVLAAFFVFATNASAQEIEAPFGMKWGMTLPEIQKLGFEVTREEHNKLKIRGRDKDRNRTKNAAKLPENTGEVELRFNKGGRLVSVYWEHDGFDTRSGTPRVSSDAQILDLLRVLSGKYGQPAKTETTSCAFDYRECKSVSWIWSIDGREINYWTNIRSYGGTTTSLGVSYLSSEAVTQRNIALRKAQNDAAEKERQRQEKLRKQF